MDEFVGQRHLILLLQFPLCVFFMVLAMVLVYSRQRATCPGTSPCSVPATMVAIFLPALLLLAYLLHRLVAFHQNSLDLVQSPIHAIARDCQMPDYSVMGKRDQGEKICVTTLTDSSRADLWQRMVRWRSFDDIIGMTWGNKVRYCKKHGYELFDESELSLDTSRAPSWSKIKATQRLLSEESCDWVFWLDADTVIMNSNKRIEDFLPRADSSIDFVVTRQKGTSFNAGAWLIRNTDWSKEFLQRWWDMKQFSRSKGQAVSGDNHALKVLLQNTTFVDGKVGVPPRCQFNSVAKFLTPQQAVALSPKSLLKEYKYLMHPENYHKGDFIAHVAGTFCLVLWISAS